MEVSAIAAEQDLRQAAAGDTSAFELLLAPLLDPAYRLATVMLGDRGAAEDAVQEASVKAWRKLGGFRGAAPELQAWFADHGDVAVFASRLLPVVRTFISLPAGSREVTVGRRF